jgi:Domain of unknown function (DUF397)
MDPSPGARAWQKSSHSNLNGCVEVAVVGTGIAVRNSRDPQGPVLEFTPDEWRAFLDGVKEGEFDLA